MNKTNHPDLIRLEKLLSDNPSWAVKILDVERGNSPQRLFINQKGVLWIHAEHLENGLQTHVETIARDRNIKTLRFEIKRKNGSGYIQIGKSILPEAAFTIPFENSKNMAAQQVTDNTAFAKAETIQPSTPAIPAVGLPGLSGAQFMDMYGQTIEKKFIEADKAALQLQVATLIPENERLKEELSNLKNQQFKDDFIRDQQAQPRTFDKAVEAVKENPAILSEGISAIAKLLEAVKPKVNGLAGPTTTVVKEPSRSPQKTKLINHIDNHDDDKAAALGDVALLMDNSPDFSVKLADLVQESLMQLMKPA